MSVEQSSGETARGAARWAAARTRLLHQIAADTAETASWTGRPALAARVMRAIACVPREAFVAPSDGDVAYDNRPLGIGCGQTISQPFIVALMSDLLDLAPGERVLEIGTGCGYQSAVLAELANEVLSLELVPELAAAAQRRLHHLGCERVHVRQGDGFRGWPEAAPFDAIIVTAAPERVPDALARQLKPGGRLVVPVGAAGATQALLRCVKEEDGRLTVQNKLSVAFVPMVPGDGYPA